MSDPVIVIRPSAGTDPLPLVFDSPHSGADYPADMGAVPDMAILRQSEDAFIDALFGHVSVVGAVLVKATFPRCYIDPNRPDDDIDVNALDGDWPGPINPGVNIGRGAGLVWTKILGQQPVYDRKLGVAELQARIENFWRPYHDALSAELDRLHAAFGSVWHVDCHSMPSRGNEHTIDGAVDRADFVLGDRDGTTCDGAFTEAGRGFLAGRGYDVAVNWPMKGVELVRKHGRPDEGRHSLQVEINRRLYMDEVAITKNDRYPETAAVVADMNAVIAEFVANRTAV